MGSVQDEQDSSSLLGDDLVEGGRVEGREVYEDHLPGEGLGEQGGLQVDTGLGGAQGDLLLLQG